MQGEAVKLAGNQQSSAVIAARAAAKWVALERELGDGEACGSGSSADAVEEGGGEGGGAPPLRGRRGARAASRGAAGGADAAVVGAPDGHASPSASSAECDAGPVVVVVGATAARGGGGGGRGGWRGGAWGRAGCGRAAVPPCADPWPRPTAPAGRRRGQQRPGCRLTYRARPPPSQTPQSSVGEQAHSGAAACHAADGCRQVALAR